MKRGIIRLLVFAALATGCTTTSEPASPRFIMVRSVATSKCNMTTIVLTKDESLSIKGVKDEPFTADGLLPKLETMKSKKNDPLFLEAKGVPYAAVARIISLLQKAGYTNLALVTEKKGIKAGAAGK